MWQKSSETPPRVWYWKQSALGLEWSGNMTSKTTAWYGLCRPYATISCYTVNPLGPIADISVMRLASWCHFRQCPWDLEENSDPKELKQRLINMHVTFGIFTYCRVLLMEVRSGCKSRECMPSDTQTGGKTSMSSAMLLRGTVHGPVHGPVHSPQSRFYTHPAT